MSIQRERMTILGLDTASRKTGYAVYRDGRIIAHGAWKIDPAHTFSDLEDKILSALGRYGVTEIVAEDIYRSRDSRLQAAFDVLSQCQGVLRLISDKSGLPLWLVDARVAKREMWGYTTARPTHRAMPRSEQKERMCRAVERLGYRLGTDRNGRADDDEADAIGILVTYVEKYRKLPVAHPGA